ncbi:cysteine protease ATG4B [Cloeon dipterum]|uniref:cysteine protease ATG4B n=1 Tax=Cloeon dipterum TaxID=197152 RepID=UPI003220041C
MDMLFDAYLTHESLQCEPDDIPCTSDPVWILGKKYDANKELAAIRKDITSRLWFTYRKGFVPIGDSGITTDRGWGCMLRCGQMVIGQALLFMHLGRDWRWDHEQRNQKYISILSMFEDNKSANYSIHQIALMGASSENKEVGQWFGPNTVAQVIKKLSPYDQWSSLEVHVALDNTLVIGDLKRLCLKQNKWSPLLLFLPLRLGLSEINPIYAESIKKCFSFPQSLGVIGGKPNHAMYFIGCVGNDLICLDPHKTQQAVRVTKECSKEDDMSFHCQFATRSPILDLDPSMAICFFCATESDLDKLCQLLHDNLVVNEKQPLFVICSERPHDLSLSTMKAMEDSNNFFNQVDEGDSDDEFEMLG